MAFTVTATQGGSTANGIGLRVYVLTSAAATQNGATSNTNFTSATTWTLSITTTQTGSRVYGAATHSPNTPGSAAAATTLVDDIADATNGERFATFKATALTGTPGATTLGFTVSGGASGPFAQAEIKTAGTLTEDASGPAAVSDLTHTFVATASFTPPQPCLLVALVASDGGVGVTTMALSDTSGLGLTWVEQAVNNPSGGDYAGVWIAQVPAAAAGVTWVPQRYGQPALFSPVPWTQRDRRDANTVGSAANPLVSPLDTAWQADAYYWHLYGDDALRDRRQYFYQRPLVSDPNLLQAAGNLDPTQNAAADTVRRYGLPATHYDRREVPAQHDLRDANTVGTPANPLPSPLDSAWQAGGHYWQLYATAAVFTDRREVPQQHDLRDANTVGTAGGTTDPTLSAFDDLRRRYGVAATHADRREVPQQRLYPDRQPDGSYTAGPSYVTGAWWSADDQGWNLQRTYLDLTPFAATDVGVGSGTTEAWWGVDPSPWQTGQRVYRSIPGAVDTPANPLVSPLDTAWQAGGGYWHRYNQAGDITARWWMPEQRLYPDRQPDGIYAAGPSYVTGAWWSGDDQGWGMQRPLQSDPNLLVPAVPLDLTTAGWLVLWLNANRAATHADRREVPQQRAYLSDPSFYTAAPVTDPTQNAAADLIRRYQLAATHADRRLVPQQRIYPDRQPDGTYTAGPSYVTGAWWSGDDQGWSLQRPLQSDPSVLATALLEGVLLGGADTARHAAWFTDRRQVPQQPLRLALQAPLVPLDPTQSAWAVLWLAYNLAATHYDRRLYPQQRLYFPVPLPPPPFTIGQLTAGTAPFAVLTAVTAPGAASGGTLTATDQRTGGPG